MPLHAAHPSSRIVLPLGALVLLATACGSGSDPDTVAETQDGITRGPADMVSDLGWRVGEDVRLARDVNGDHRTDLIGFGPDGVHIALAQGDSFATPQVVLPDLSGHLGWHGATSVRALADVDGDGRLDLVGIGPFTVRVSLATASGTYTGPTTAVWSGDYSAAAGWNPAHHALMLGDVNGDGKADLVGINDWGVYVSLSTGTSFGPQQLWLRAFSATEGGWDAAKHVRLLADVNNDGLADIVGFGDDGVSVALSDGARFRQLPVKSSSQFGNHQGWGVGPHIRTIANVNGDAFPDLIGIGPGGVTVALGTGTGYDTTGGFAPATLWSTEFGDGTGWDATRHVRLIGDVDGDGKDDVVGIKDDQVLLALSTGGSFGAPTAVSSDFTFNQGWRVDQHPRLLADVDGDGQIDLVGFFHDAINWARLVPAAPPVPSNWDTPACAATRLQPPAPNTCEGPWQYTQVQRCVSVDATACPQHCTAFGSCALWENGAAATAATTETTAVVGPNTRLCSNTCRGVGCTNPSCTGTITQPTSDCQAAAAARTQDLRSQISSAVTAEQNFDSAAAQSQRSTDAQNLVSATPTYLILTTSFNTQDLPGGSTINTWTEQWGCQLSVVSAAPVTATNEACGCTATTASACEHDCGSSTLFTAPGMERPISPGISSQICMTHDDLPQATPADIQAKFEALWTTLHQPAPSTVPAATFTRAIATRLKLIYELFGDQLIDDHDATDEVHRAIALYGSNPDDNPSCALDIDAPAVPAACTNPAVKTTRGDLIRCQRLVNDSAASTAVASLALADCTALMNGYLGLVPLTADDAACGGPHLRQVGAQTLLGLEDKQLAVINSAPTTLGSLPRQLWLLDGWYTASQAAAAAGVFSSPDQLRRNTSFLLGNLWDHLRKNTSADSQLAAVASATTTADAEAALGLSAVASRGTEQGVVSALFTVPPTIQPENVTLHRPPLRSLPLLAMLGDALTPLVNDLDAIAVYHDIACQFRDCIPDVPDNDTPTRFAWRLLAELESTALANDITNHNTHNLAGWTPALAALAAQQPGFTQAVADAVTGPGGLAGATTDDQVHPLARPLWLLYRHARAFNDHFAATGQFESTAQNVLQSSVLQSDQLQKINDLRERANRLQGAVNDYESGLIASVKAELDVMQHDVQLSALHDQREHKADEMNQISRNIDGLRAAEADEATAFGSLAETFAAMQAALDQGALVQVGNSATLTLTGGDGRFTGTLDLANLSVHTVPNLASGQALLVQTSGDWTPTCALKAASFLGPSGDKAFPASLTNAVTGPEGYAITNTGNVFSAVAASSSDSRTSELGLSLTICVGTGPFTGAIGLDAKACVFGDEKSTSVESNSTNSGSETRTAASFATGIRLPGTPFPDAPAGSLLVVLADPQTGAVRDVTVAHSGATNLMIEAPSTAYLIVNDQQCAFTPNGDQLTVNVRTMSPPGSGAAGDQVLNGMVDVLALMRDKQQTWVDQGTLTATQPTELRDQANQLLAARLPFDISLLPAPLASLFNGFVSHQIVSVERRIQIIANERALQLDEIDMKTIDDEFAAGTQQGRLQRLIPQWMVRNLDHEFMRESLVDLLVVSRDHVKPILELWYPHALEQVQLGDDFSAMLHADVDTSLLTLAQQGVRFVNSLLDAYQNGTFGSKGPADQLPIVVLQFPRPGSVNDNAFWREVDAVRSQRVWDAIDNARTGNAVAGTLGHFEVTPEDFYSKNGGDAVLSCNEVVPVIKSAELFVVRPSAGPSNDVLNGVGRHFPGLGAATQSFVQLDGPQVFELGDSVWQVIDLPVRYGENEATLDTFRATPRQARPIGLSASGSFDLDFSVLNTLTKHGQFDPSDPFPVTAINLVMELDSRAVGDRPTWVKRCK